MHYRLHILLISFLLSLLMPTTAVAVSYIEDGIEQMPGNGKLYQTASVTDIEWCDSDYYITLDHTATLDEIQDMLPERIGVHLNNSNDISYIPVSWEVISVYSDSSIIVYDLCPVLSGYVCEDSLPHICVEIDCKKKQG